MNICWTQLNYLEILKYFWKVMSNQSQNICIFRLSAMGDVIMLVQAVRNLLEANLEITITVVTRPAFQVFFGKHERLHFHDLSLHDTHKGLLGLHKLYKELKQHNFDYFLDMHDVMRSQIVRSFFKLAATKVLVIKKERKIKEAIVAKKAPLTQQKHSIERYLDVARKAGLKTTSNYRYILPKANEDQSKLTTIGIAPFAAHPSKEWGEENLLSLLQLLDASNNYQVLLFGGGEREKTILEKWESQFPFVRSVAGQYKLSEELVLMANCSCFVAMDSGNMHMASLVGVNTISIWISTHPYLGFAPWGNESYILQPSQKEAPCRPVSVYGKIKSEAQQQCVEKSRILITPRSVMECITKIL